MHNIFGSADSFDYDIMVFVDELPSIQRSKEMCSELEFGLQTAHPDKKRNVNLAVIRDGIITDVFKGTSDECNNSIFRTYHLHHQVYPLLIKREVPRDVNLKLARGLRSILSFLSRTNHRDEVKMALKGDASDKMRILESISFSDIVNLNKNNQDVIEFRKQSAFQMGQCVCLMNGIEVYTKNEISDHHPSLSAYLHRENTIGNDLELFKQRFLAEIGKLDLSKITENR